jgi:hypothetical protein
MALSGSDDRRAPAGANSVVLDASGPNPNRQRLAEALRANLGRRKAQKRDRAKQAASAPVQDETPSSKAGQSPDRMVPPQDPRRHKKTKQDD